MIVGTWSCGRRWSWPGAVAGLVAVGLAISCGGGSTPTQPPTSTPTGVPTVAPTTPPAGGGSGASCTLGMGDSDALCQHASSTLFGKVQAAIDVVVKQHPGYFDLSQEWGGSGTRQYRVLDGQGYQTAVIANLRAGGYCSDFAPDLTHIEVKSTNDFSENYQILLSNGYIRRDRDAYRETCTPADFPLDVSENIPPLGSGCDKPYPPPLNKMGVKVNTVSSEMATLDSTPLIVDFNYCRSIGYTDGRSFCPVRVEHGPERTACEDWRVGNAADTGEAGPTWKGPHGYCTGPSSGCEHVPGNAYELWVYHNGVGDYSCCSQSGACGYVTVDPF